mmetsp:Transcript_82246/g.255631  ORF Transcript_82246/g.255631 Transcript_82246/m.255631 type:complete len:261 (+) Transcript_82246:132-914(+)
MPGCSQHVHAGGQLAPSALQLLALQDLEDAPGCEVSLAIAGQGDEEPRVPQDLARQGPLVLLVAAGQGRAEHGAAVGVRDHAADVLHEHLENPAPLVGRPPLDEVLQHVVAVGVLRDSERLGEDGVHQTLHLSRWAALEEPLHDAAAELVLRGGDGGRLQQLVDDELRQFRRHRQDAPLEHVVRVRGAQRLPHVPVELLCQRRELPDPARHLEGLLHRAAAHEVLRQGPNAACDGPIRCVGLGHRCARRLLLGRVGARSL